MKTRNAELLLGVLTALSALFFFALLGAAIFEGCVEHKEPTYERR
jgi:hypothetical protein